MRRPIALAAMLCIAPLVPQAQGPPACRMCDGHALSTDILRVPDPLCGNGSAGHRR